MKIWVDADACPNPIKEILFRAAERTGIALVLVANHDVRIKPSRHISFMRVASGFDVADDEIVKRLEPGDLVITSPVPAPIEGMKLRTLGARLSEQAAGARAAASSA